MLVAVVVVIFVFVAATEIQFPTGLTNDLFSHPTQKIMCLFNSTVRATQVA